jgi:hypothetical protein
VPTSVVIVAGNANKMNRLVARRLNLEGKRLFRLRWPRKTTTKLTVRLRRSDELMALSLYPFPLHQFADVLSLPVHCGQLLQAVAQVESPLAPEF